jgi:hypothetical protein
LNGLWLGESFKSKRLNNAPVLDESRKTPRRFWLDGKDMVKPDDKRDLETLIAETEKIRAELHKTWRKMENLDAAIQSSRSARRKGRPDSIKKS